MDGTVIRHCGTDSGDFKHISIAYNDSLLTKPIPWQTKPVLSRYMSKVSNNFFT